MRIDACELYHMSIPCRGDIRPYWSIPALSKDLPPAPRHWETVLLRVRSGDFEGWGECSPGELPIDSGEWAAGAFLLLGRVFAAALVGKDIANAEQAAKCWQLIHGNLLAKAAVDQAIWDLQARQAGVSLSVLLGGGNQAVPVRARLRVGDSLGEMVAAVRAACEAGCGEVNVKMQAAQSEVLRALRTEFPTLPLSVDCEGQGNLNQQTEFCRLDDFFLKSLEQPLGVDDVVGHAMLQQQLRTPICLDQTIHSLGRLQDAVEFQSCRQVRIEPGRLGGLSVARQVAGEAVASQLVCGLGTRPQTAIGQRGALALQELLCPKSGPTALTADYFPAAQYFESDVAEPLPSQRDADGKLVMRLPEAPGIGLTPDTAWLKQYTIGEIRM